MKILIIGVGGIGSYLVKEIRTCQLNQQISPHTEISIADDDIVEIEQIMYQSYEVLDAGKNKAEATANKYDYAPINKRITKKEQLKKYDYVILCVDNDATRKLVLESGKEFLDLRSQGRRISAFPKLSRTEDNLAFIDEDDKKNYSCQDEESLKRGEIDLGNKVVALIGAQMLLNYLRGKKNKAISLNI